MLKAFVKYSCLLTVVVLLFLSCQDGNHRGVRILADAENLSHVRNEYLKSAYSFIDARKLDSARACLNRVSTQSLSDGDKAFYNLMRTKLDYVSYIPIVNDSLIAYSVAYYDRQGNERFLAESLFYQSMVLYGMGNEKGTFRLLKKAEVYANRCNDDILKHKILEALTSYNMEEGEFDVALGYAKKTCALAKHMDDFGRIGYAYAFLSQIYRYKGQKDSAYYYMEECKAYVDSIPVRERVDFYGYLAVLYMDTDRKQAEEYVGKGVKLRRTFTNCCLLARLKYERGDKKEAYGLLAQALALSEYTRDSMYVYGSAVDLYLSDGDYERAFLAEKELFDVTEHLNESIRENDAKATQMAFDAEMKQMQERRNFVYAIVALVVLALCVFILWLYRRYRYNKVSREVMKNELLIRTYKEKVEAMSSSQEKERVRYSQELSKVQEQQSKMLGKGMRLYEHVMADGTIVTWTQKDMKLFIEYYKLVDMSFVDHLEKDYDRLSCRYMFFEILYHIGKQDEAVERIMGISNSSVRSIKSRVRKKLLAP